MRAAAVEEISVAILRDNAGDFAGAVAAYACGIDLFEALLAASSTDSEQFQYALRQRIDSYRARSEELRFLIAKDAEEAPISTASATTIDAAAVITEAVRADQREDYAAAIDLYEHGVQLLEARLAVPTDSPQFRDAVRLRVTGYLQRCAALRDVMRIGDDAPRVKEANGVEPAAWMSRLIRPKEPGADAAARRAMALASGSSVAASTTSSSATTVPCTLSPAAAAASPPPPAPGAVPPPPPLSVPLGAACECSFMYRYILRESCSQFDSLPLTSLTLSVH